jgi:hypothetical protein
MKFSESVASHCRYGDVAEEIWKDWNIIWEDSVDDYQGHASFVLEKDGKYVFYEWWYGSCSGCDGWESQGLTGEQIEKEMRETALWLDSKEDLFKWLNMLEGTVPISQYNEMGGGGFGACLDILSGGLVQRINAIRKHFGLREYTKEDFDRVVKEQEEKQKEKK